jgi:DNA replication protein DnaC
MALEQCPCMHCGKSVEFDPTYRLGNETLRQICDECDAKQRVDRSSRDTQVRLSGAWVKRCPARFLNTDIAKLPCMEKSQAAISWGFEDGQGLNLWGEPDTGKTRTLYLVMRKLHFAGKSWRVFTPADFMYEMESRVYTRSKLVRQVASLSVIGFDDVDKLPLTGPQEKVLFAILDSRMSSNAPCLFTHNSTAGELEATFKTGKALIRRIRQFTKSLHFP